MGTVTAAVFDPAPVRHSDTGIEGVRLSMATAEHETATLAAMANMLLAEGEHAERHAGGNAAVIAALEEMRHLDSADLGALEHALRDATLIAAMHARPANARRGDASLITLTGGNGERVLPLFTSERTLRRGIKDRTVVGSPLEAQRAFEAAIGLGFDAIEIDRGCAHARRIGRVDIKRLAKR